MGNYVIGESRMDFTHTNRVYDSWWYDVDGQKLVHEDGGYYSIVPEGPPCPFGRYHRVSGNGRDAYEKRSSGSGSVFFSKRTEKNGFL